MDEFIINTEKDIAYNLNKIVSILNSWSYKEDFNQYDDIYKLLRLAECQKERLNTLRRIKNSSINQNED